MRIENKLSSEVSLFKIDWHKHLNVFRGEFYEDKDEENKEVESTVLYSILYPGSLSSIALDHSAENNYGQKITKIISVKATYWWANKNSLQQIKW